MMGADQPDRIEDAAVVLHLHVEVAEENRSKFLEFCRRAFPIYESAGGCKMALYEDKSDPGRFDEVGYYRTSADFQRGEDAIKSDPVQSALIKEWRSLLRTAPKVAVYLQKQTGQAESAAKSFSLTEGHSESMMLK